MMSKNKNKTVLALYPNSNGIAFSLFFTPKELIDFGLAYVQPVCNIISMKRIKKYLEYYKPDVIILRDAKVKGFKSKRILKLIEKISKEAKSQNLEIHSYSSGDIKEVFKNYNAFTKYEISKVLIEAFPELRVKEYPKRKRWMKEHHNEGVFSAVALYITYQYLQN